MKLKQRLTSYVLTVLSLLFAGSSQAMPSVWDVLRQELKLNHAINQPAVQQQLYWLTNHPSYLRKLAQSEPYIYHIMTEIKKRHLPGEIALIPMIESAYDPFAYSGVGAAGLWQLMPGTGTHLGLKQDWWFDARRSIGPSTDAALNYLVHLQRFFHGDWLLAFAAYDSGEGTIARSIKANQHGRSSPNFWTLPVPRETRAYVPRLLALAEIIQNPERYHVHLPHIPSIPYFEEVNIGSQIDLNHAARLAGMSYRDLLKLNPGFNRWATAPYWPFKLLIPTNKVAHFSRNLANLPLDQRVSLTQYRVNRGDNLAFIALRHHTTVSLIKELNQLHNGSVKEGQLLMIPSPKNTPAVAQTHFSAPPKATSHFVALKQYKVLHIVQRFENTQQIAQKYAVTVKQLRDWNHLSTQTALKPGQQLIVWKNALPTRV